MHLRHCQEALGPAHGTITASFLEGARFGRKAKLAKAILRNAESQPNSGFY